VITKRDGWAQCSAQLQQSGPLIWFEEDAFLGNAFAEHLILRFEEFDLASEFLISRTSKQKQQRLENLTHSG